jgi:hypothetical protein
MKKTLLLIAPVAMLALAACNKNPTPAEGDAATGTSSTGTPTATATAPVNMPPAITSKGTYRCKDSTVLYVDFLGANEAADIRVGSITAPAIRVSQVAPAAPAAGTTAVAEAPKGPLKSADGTAMLSGSGDQINVKIGDKGAQSCKK